MSGVEQGQSGAVFIGVAWLRGVGAGLAGLMILALFAAGSYAAGFKPIGLLSAGCFFLFAFGLYRMATAMWFASCTGFLLRLAPDGIQAHGLQAISWELVLGAVVVERSHGGRSWPELRLLMRTDEPRLPSWVLSSLGRPLRKGDELILSGALWGVDAVSLRTLVADFRQRFAPDADADWQSGEPRAFVVERLKLRELLREAKQQATVTLERLKNASSAEEPAALSAWTQASNRHLELMQRQVRNYSSNKERYSGASPRMVGLCLLGVLVGVSCLVWLQWAD